MFNYLEIQTNNNQNMDIYMILFRIEAGYENLRKHFKAATQIIDFIIDFIKRNLGFSTY